MTIEFGTLGSALHLPRRVWVDRINRRCGWINDDMPSDVRAEARRQGQI